MHRVEELLRGTSIPIIELVQELIEAAHERRASDIHIDPTPFSVRVRFRVDGALCESYTVPKVVHHEIISRIKILTGLRTDEHQATQDGRFCFVRQETGEEVDIRVSIMPTYYGENAVLRILSDKVAGATLDTLGFSVRDQKKIFEAITKPHGMILATGPTGSGKTTTLYALIKLLNHADASLLTIEDPIEYSIPGITQIQVNQRTGLTFASGLRSILRQDPNTIMVGEIRDAETAAIAVNTALTGHLLLSTLHTNDSATTLPRLLDMGVDRYLVASTVAVAIAQRLVRKICEECKEGVVMTRAMAQALSDIPLSRPVTAGEVLYHGVGCEMCVGTGYRGRLCIGEVLVADDTIREAILSKAPANTIRECAVAQGMTTMLEDGFTKARSGQTTVEEVLRTVHV